LGREQQDADDYGLFVFGLGEDGAAVRRMKSDEKNTRKV
jgi:hypothetical protein